MFTLDTNALIYYAAQEKTAVDFLLPRIKNQSRFFIPSVVAIEFLSYPVLTSQDKKFFADSLDYFSFIPLHFEIALLAADIKQKHGLKLAGSVVAATAIFAKTTLVTRNIYSKASGLRKFLSI
jgi:predicted nucleic acid-binding protein